MTDWHIGPQTREAQLARFRANLDRIFARGAEEARNPPYPKLRAAADLQDALRNESYREGLGCDGMSEALDAGRHDDANRREPWAKRVAGGRR